MCTEIVDDIIFALEVTKSLDKLLDLLFFWLQLLFQRGNLSILLLFNSIDDIAFHFVKARLELAEAFFKDTCHTNKHISDLLRHCGTERRFKLWLHGLNDGFGVPLAWIAEGYEGVLELQYLSDNDLHCVFGLFTLALDNAVFVEDFRDSVVHLDDSRC